MGNSSSSRKKKARRRDEQVLSTRPPPQRGGNPPPQYLGYDPTAPPLHAQDPRVTAMRKDVSLLPEAGLRRSPASSVTEEDLYHQQYPRPFTYTPQQQQQQQNQQQTQALQQRRPQTAIEKPPRADKQKKRKDKEKPRGKENVQVRPEELPGYSILPLKQGFDPTPAPASERAPPEDGVLKSGTARRDFRRHLEHQLEQPRRVSPSPGPPAVSLEDYARRDNGQQRLPPEQLRSLLPWSYLAPPEELPRRHAKADSDADLEMPPVPVPDYTLHFGQRARDRLPSSSPTSSTSGYAEERAHGAGVKHKEPLY